MAGLTGRRIVLGVTGGIAAYKAIEVCRRLVDLGAHVVPDHDATTRTASSVRRRSPRSLPSRCTPRCGMTVIRSRTRASGSRPISWSSLPRRLASSPRTRPACQRRPPHRRRARHAGARHRVPGDAHRDVGARSRCRTTSRPCGGAACTSSTPSPDVSRAATSASGRLATPRRSSPPSSVCSRRTDMAGLRVLVTAGGTREPIDAVRVIANRSSGKQGHALAFEAAARGASVTVVTTVGRPVPAGAEVVAVETAAEMEAAVLARAASTRCRRHGRGRRRLPAEGRGRPQDQEGRRAARDRPRADPRHPGRPRRGASARVRRSSGSRPRPTTLAANAEGKLRRKDARPDRRQRRLGARRRVRARHQRGRDPRDRRSSTNVSLTRQAGRGRCGARRRHGHSRAGATREHAAPSPPSPSPRAIPTRWPTRSPTPSSTPSSPRTRWAGWRARRCSRPASPSSPARSPPRPTSTSRSIVRDTIVGIGYDRESFGFDGNTCGVMVVDRPAVAEHRPGRRHRRRDAHGHVAARTSSTARAPATRG